MSIIVSMSLDFAECDRARLAREFATADRIRKELDKRYSVTLKDTPQGAVWSVKE